MSMQGRGVAVPRETTTLADLLDRVLDKGLVVAGDISVSLANVELLTIRIRLLVCSIDKAEQIGLNWWRNDPRLSTSATMASFCALTSWSVEGIEDRHEVSQV